MSIQLKIKKGLDLNVAGKVVSSEVEGVIIPDEIAVFPDDFPGMTPKLDVKEGDRILKGEPVFHDKIQEEIKVVAPATGVIKEVVRG
ncbi:MAG: NADH:ubiquinone reductase (Na(+)-transporting) subunit A, partial [Muribaculaceae bacterium]|nr:NADH:ubiquinone reductase (Na(+)-transporting) subunit A [Muribaculaceae bacterium]